MNVELRHLRSFVVLADELNFTRAAARLHLAQQALSAQILQLEERVGTQLFQRTTRKVELTPAGSALLEEAPKLLAAAERAVAAAREAADVEERQLKVGILGTGFLDITPAIIHAFEATHPRIRVALHNYKIGDDRSAGVRQRETDIAIVWLPFRSEDLETLPIYEDRRVALLSSSHPLAARSRLRAAELAAQPFAWVKDIDQVAGDYWMLAEHRDGPPVVGADVNDFDEYFAAIRLGHAVAAPPESMTRALPPGMTTRPVTGLAPAQLAVCWRRGDRSRDLEAFIETARTVHDAPGTEHPLVPRRS